MVDGAKIGRPSSFTQEAADEICDRLSHGESLRSICSDEESGWLPSETTVRRWLSGGEEWNAEFRRQYAHAREAQADCEFDEARQIASAATPENVQVARLQIDTIKWRASKLAPKKYGEKITAEVSGVDGGPIQTDEAAAAARIAALIAAAKERKADDAGG